MQRRRLLVAAGPLAVALSGAAAIASGATSVAEPPMSAAAVNAAYKDQRPAFAADDPYRQDMASRWAFGLRYDKAYVAEQHRRLAARDPQVTTGVIGGAIPVTTSEAAELTARELAGREDVPVVRAYFATRADDYAGVYMDHLTGKLTAMAIDNAALHLTALRAIVKYPERLAVATVRNTLSTLNAVSQQVRDLADEARSQGIDAVGASGSETTANVITIRVESSADEAQAFFASRLPAGTFAVRQGSAVTPTGQNTYAGTPWKTATNILGNGWSCTSGYTVYRDPPKVAQRTYYMATTGHCYLNGETVGQPDSSHNIGSTGARCWDAATCTGEAILINMTQTLKSYTVVKTPGGNNFNVRFQQGQAGDWVDMPTCISVGATTEGGVRNNWYCGTVSDTSYDTLQWQADPRGVGANRKFYYLRQVLGIWVYPGDSGAPWFNGLSTNQATALGILYGRGVPEFGPEAWYHHIYDVRHDTNADGVYRTG